LPVVQGRSHQIPADQCERRRVAGIHASYLAEAAWEPGGRLRKPANNVSLILMVIRVFRLVTERTCMGGATKFWRVEFAVYVALISFRR